MTKRIRQTFDPAKLLIAAAGLLIFGSSAIAQQGAIMAVDEPPAAAAAAGAAGSPESGQQARSGSARTSSRSSSRSRNRRTPQRSKTADQAAKRKAAAAKKYDGFVIGDKYSFLNFEVVSAEKPYYTRAAKESGAKGLVQVEILIDEDGSVLTAKARTGNKELWPEAERAALASKFNRPSVYGKPARATGFLVYRFGPAED